MNSGLPHFLQRCTVLSLSQACSETVCTLHFSFLFQARTGMSILSHTLSVLMSSLLETAPLTEQNKNLITSDIPIRDEWSQKHPLPHTKDCSHWCKLGLLAMSYSSACQVKSEVLCDLVCWTKYAPMGAVFGIWEQMFFRPFIPYGCVNVDVSCPKHKLIDALLPSDVDHAARTG